MGTPRTVVANIRSSGAGLLLLAASLTRAADTPVEQPPAAAPDALPNVVVEAPEPKYVAPTLRDRIGRIWAPVMINGKGPFRLVLDTGASHSAVISTVADTLGLPSNSDTIMVRGVTGAAVVPAIKVQRIEVGAVLIEPSVLPVVADVFGGAQGVLGREGMPDKRIFADFRKDILVISRSHHERAGVGYNVVPLKLIKGGLLATEVLVGSVHAQAIIDTGGQQTVGNMALREALTRYNPKDPVSQDIVGVTLDLQHGNTVTAPPVNLGSLTLHGMRVTFGDMYLFEHMQLTRQPTLLLGMDVLGSFDALVIDYRMRELQIRPRASLMTQNR